MKRIATIICTITAAALITTGCADEEKAPSAQTAGQKLTEQAFKQQSSAVPYPADDLKDSLERRNLREKLLRDNKPNAIRYVYLLSFAQPLGYYTIKGKVSSTQSQMTTDQLIACKDARGDGDSYCDSSEQHVVNAPGDDGSYGANESGVFFFTTEGVMVTTNLDYIVSDQPLPFDVPELDR